MLAYAAGRRSLAQRRSSPQAMLAIAAAHVAVVALVMSARMEIEQARKAPPTMVDLIELPKLPPPPEPQPKQQPRPSQSVIDTPPVLTPVPLPDVPLVDVRPVPIPFDPVVGTAIEPQPRIEPRPVPTPVRTGPRFATPDHLLRPPYPQSRLASGDEAELSLRLTIDERGRVVAVEPVGAADPAFLASARKHLLAKWRYKPATDDGRPVTSSTVIRLRFELD